MSEPYCPRRKPLTSPDCRNPTVSRIFVTHLNSRFGQQTPLWCWRATPFAISALSSPDIAQICLAARVLGCQQTRKLVAQECKPSVAGTAITSFRSTASRRPRLYGLVSA
jgi:hypothetical protein